LVYIYKFPAVVEGLLCHDYQCLRPEAVDIDGDYMAGGDSVSVAANAATVAVVYASGFGNEEGIKVATIATPELGVGSFTSQSLHSGEVCGPVDVQMSYSHMRDDTPLVVFTGARCQNITYVCCLDSTCKTRNETVISTNSQPPRDPTSFTIFRPSLVSKPTTKTALISWAEHRTDSSGGTDDLRIAYMQRSNISSQSTVVRGYATTHDMSFSPMDNSVVFVYQRGHSRGDRLDPAIFATRCISSTCSALDDNVTLDYFFLSNSIRVSSTGIGVSVASYDGSCLDGIAGWRACLRVAILFTGGEEVVAPRGSRMTLMKTDDVPQPLAVHVQPSDCGPVEAAGVRAAELSLPDCYTALAAAVSRCRAHGPRCAVVLARPAWNRESPSRTKSERSLERPIAPSDWSPIIYGPCRPLASTARRAPRRPEGKIHRVDPDFGSTLTASNRDYQSNCWVNWKIMGQPCEFQVPGVQCADGSVGRVPGRSH
jgi:hypothetical protein